MFTGIVAGVGLVKKIDNFQGSKKIFIKCPFSLSRVRLGDSIAVDGCCLTVTSKRGQSFSADVSPETLRVTTLGELQVGSQVNLEQSLKVGDALGGHWVQGHVDGVGKLVSRRQSRREQESYEELEIQLPPALMRYMISKGSITVDGISLTVNGLKKNRVCLCLIPHTLERTALTGKPVGARVNIEADFLLKFLESRLAPLSKKMKLGKRKNNHDARPR